PPFQLATTRPSVMYLLLPASPAADTQSISRGRENAAASSASLIGLIPCSTRLFSPVAQPLTPSVAGRASAARATGPRLVRPPTFDSMLPFMAFSVAERAPNGPV